ncbi:MULTISPECIES: class I SAM-dependent methyltransferase [unclassified Thioalkalivibrio]|uniref:class I SAM-dependent methyltransferase n=1 Tax=unclassified Thioalkalivibrio TaxID=2621013 RepID=UPI00036CB8D3|nr:MULTISPECIES: class I SAM-dependent methyltransferase [unclassified Thioalkalivibrio]
MKDTGFERRWRQRFLERGASLEDDADIAGWTHSGLNSRVRQFERLWRSADLAPGRWLDIGCGAGTYTRMLQAQGHAVWGLDYSTPSLQKARARSDAAIPWLAADINHLPLADAAFDGVLCFGVMQALSDPAPALAEIRRVLRPGGEAWVDALNLRCLPTAAREWHRHRQGRPPHLRYDDPAALRSTAESVGLVPGDLYWLPLAPGRLARLQPLLENRGTRGFLQALPIAGAWLSHSFILRMRKE